MSDPLKESIQTQLSDLDGEFDVLAIERPGGEALRIFIDHPEGIDLARCEEVTHHLGHLLADYSLEVSSPGPKYGRSGTSSDIKESPQ